MNRNPAEIFSNWAAQDEETAKICEALGDAQGRKNMEGDALYAKVAALAAYLDPRERNATPKEII